MNKDFLIKIGLAIGALLIVWFIIDRIFGISKKWKEDADETKRQEKQSLAQVDEIAKMKKEGIGPSYPKSKYMALADGLFQSMKGAGTDTNRVMQIISQLRNSRDFLELQAAFGIREGENLNQWIAGDLSSGRISEINNYLRSKGIKYGF